MSWGRPSRDRRNGDGAVAQLVDFAIGVPGQCQRGCVPVILNSSNRVGAIAALRDKHQQRFFPGNSLQAGRRDNGYGQAQNPLHKRCGGTGGVAAGAAGNQQQAVRLVRCHGLHKGAASAAQFASIRWHKSGCSRIYGIISFMGESSFTACKVSFHE